MGGKMCGSGGRGETAEETEGVGDQQEGQDET